MLVVSVSKNMEWPALLARYVINNNMATVTYGVKRTIWLIYFFFFCRTHQLYACCDWPLPRQRRILDLLMPIVICGVRIFIQNTAKLARFIKLLANAIIICQRIPAGPF